MLPPILPAGVYTMGITPFDESGRLDEGALRSHVERLTAEGIGVFPASAYTGEGPQMSDAEMWRVWEITVEAVAGRLPVIGANREFLTAKQNLAFAREAEARGLDGLQIYPLTFGHGTVPTRAMIAAFYHDVLEDIKLPVVLSSNDLTGYEVPRDLHAELIGRYESKIIGFCKFHADPFNVSAFVRELGTHKSVLTGTQNSMDWYALGLAGTIDGIQNVAPRTCRRFHDAFCAGDLTEAVRWYRQITELNTALKSWEIDHGSNRLLVHKGVLKILGLPGGSPRKPFIPLDAGELGSLRELVRRLGIAELEGL